MNRSYPPRKPWDMIFFIAVAATAYLGSGGAVRAETQADRVCFSTAESRERIHAHGLLEPFQLMRATASRWHAEAIGVKLCRWRESLVYELSLLRHDGHVIYVFVDAQNGQPAGSKNER
jgi:uncharacterized membrane protein YkoI